VFGLSQKAQPRTQPKSEVTHCKNNDGQTYWQAAAAGPVVHLPGDEVHVPDG